jgi:hypothetical protein
MVAPTEYTFDAILTYPDPYDCNQCNRFSRVHRTNGIRIICLSCRPLQSNERWINEDESGDELNLNNLCQTGIRCFIQVTPNRIRSISETVSKLRCRTD